MLEHPTPASGHAIKCSANRQLFRCSSKLITLSSQVHPSCRNVQKTTRLSTSHCIFWAGEYCIIYNMSYQITHNIIIAMSTNKPLLFCHTPLSTGHGSLALGIWVSCKFKIISLLLCHAGPHHEAYSLSAQFSHRKCPQINSCTARFKRREQCGHW